MTKEEAAKFFPLLKAYSEGKQIQYRPFGSDGSFCDVEEPSWNRPASDYRIKPEPKLRPWRPEEVPLGAWARNIQCPSRYLIVAFTTTDVYFGIGSAAFSFQECLDEKEYSTDNGKTWKPCGVEE